MDLSPSWEAASCAAIQELPSILWNTIVHYLVHKSPPLVQKETTNELIQESNPKFPWRNGKSVRNFIQQNHPLVNNKTKKKQKN
jgi:hypothetical protein